MGASAAAQTSSRRWRSGRAVMLGRPVLWGLAVGGQQGVATVLALLRAELDTAMALCGCASLADIGPDLLRLPRLGASLEARKAP